MADLGSQTSALKQAALVGPCVLILHVCVTFILAIQHDFSPYEGSDSDHHFFHGLWNMFVEALCQFRVVNPMHESGDPHAFKGYLHAFGFHLESFHELRDGLSVSLFDIVDFDRIFDILLLLHEVKMIKNEAKNEYLQAMEYNSQIHCVINPTDSNAVFHLSYRKDHVAHDERVDPLAIRGEDENAEDVQMADHLRPMEELLQITILGIENAIGVPAVLADQFELKPELLNFVSNNSFFGLENDDPQSHIRRFYQITPTLRLNQMHDDVVKLILFPFSLKGAAETWLENKPPNSITSWDDLESKFLNRFFSHSKTRELRKEITIFQQVFGETFTEAWERFKDLLRKCPHHEFSLLHQIDFFYNELCQSDQDSLNTAAGGNLMTRNNQDAFTNIENKARVQTCRNTPQVSSDGGNLESVNAKSNGSNGRNFSREAIIPHSLVYHEKEQEPETITEVVEIPSSQSTPLVPPPETPPLFAPKPKDDPKPNPYQPSIPYPLAIPLPLLILWSSLSPILLPYASGEFDLLIGGETDALSSLDDSIPPGIDNGIYDLEGDILFLEELLNDEIQRDLPPIELKDDEPSTTKSCKSKNLLILIRKSIIPREISFSEKL
ncbi:reverse transcriptase domain-containing protein [Tanacetum coccineum]